ncbi:MAG: hypothetical protein ACE5QF_03570 [Thermoplasmata archaeon]
MPLRRRFTLAQRFLLVGALLCVALGFLMLWLRDQCVDTYFAEIIGCKNQPYDVGIYAMNIIAALLMSLSIFFMHRYPRVLGLFTVMLGLVLIWVGDIGSFFGGLFAFAAGLLTLTSLL